MGRSAVAAPVRSLNQGGFVRIVPIALVASLLVAAEGSAQVAYQTGTIGGSVLLTDGSPVGTATIRAEALDGLGVVETTVDATGAYSLVVPAGEYRVTASYDFGPIPDLLT